MKKQDIKKTNNARNVIAVGPSGVGKSSMLNFLSNMDKNIQKKSHMNYVVDVSNNKYEQYFKVSKTASNSETRFCSSKRILFDDVEWNFIDMPGFDDSNGKKQNLLNVVEMIKLLNDIQDIHAVIICYGFNEKIVTAPMRKVYDFVGKFFKICFPSNVICVVTKMSMTEESKEEREFAYQGKSNEKILDEIRSMMSRVLNVPDVPLFHLDSVPVKSDKKTQHMSGLKILNHIKNLQRSIRVANLIVPKPELIMDYCTNKIISIKALSQGFFEGVCQFDEKTKMITEFLSKERIDLDKYIETKNKIEFLEKEILLMNTQNYMTITNDAKYPIRAHKILTEEENKLIAGKPDTSDRKQDEIILYTFCSDYWKDIIDSKQIESNKLKEYIKKFKGKYEIEDSVESSEPKTMSDSRYSQSFVVSDGSENFEQKRKRMIEYFLKQNENICEYAGEFCTVDYILEWTKTNVIA